MAAKKSGDLLGRIIFGVVIVVAVLGLTGSLLGLDGFTGTSEVDRCLELLAEEYDITESDAETTAFAAAAAQPESTSVLSTDTVLSTEANSLKAILGTKQFKQSVAFSGTTTGKYDCFVDSDCEGLETCLQNKCLDMSSADKLGDEVVSEEDCEQASENLDYFLNGLVDCAEKYSGYTDEDGINREIESRCSNWEEGVEFLSGYLQSHCEEEGPPIDGDVQDSTATTSTDEGEENTSEEDEDTDDTSGEDDSDS